MKTTNANGRIAGGHSVEQSKADRKIIYLDACRRKPCCKVPVHFNCECAQFHAMRERVRAVRRYLAGGV